MNVIDQIRASPAARHWEKIGIKNHFGIVVPLFSLHSEKSAGIGEYPDLLPLLPWCHSVGLDVIQLLPLNDTGPNTSPYSAISAYALSPIHLGIASLPEIQENSRLFPLLQELQELTATDRVDYAKIAPMREMLLREYFKEYHCRIISSPDYKTFEEQNPWLETYALFKLLKTHANWQSWDHWPEDIRMPTPQSIAFYKKKHESDMTYHIFLQYFCFQQLKKVKEEAEKIGVLIKGDLPLLLDRESVDVWTHRSLFNLDDKAGAPPDAFSQEGQKWGFPLYNWAAIQQQDYDWWKQRLQIASNFYHIYRLDHVVGFFRVWAIADDKPAKEGRHIPEQFEEALDQGTKILTALLNASPLLPIGEDLGVVPLEVRKELTKLGICGTSVMRWERYWESGKAFKRPEEYPPLSVTTVSTHDSSPLQVWWTENSDEARAYALSQGWHYETPMPPEYQFTLLYHSCHTSSLFHINLLQEYLALIPGMAAEDPRDERINTPGTISEENWSYRFRPSVEEIVSHPELALLFQELRISHK